MVKVKYIKKNFFAESCLGTSLVNVMEEARILCICKTQKYLKRNKVMSKIRRQENNNKKKVLDCVAAISALQIQLCHFR